MCVVDRLLVVMQCVRVCAKLRELQIAEKRVTNFELGLLQCSRGRFENVLKGGEGGRLREGLDMLKFRAPELDTRPLEVVFYMVLEEGEGDGALVGGCFGGDA